MEHFILFHIFDDTIHKMVSPTLTLKVLVTTIDAQWEGMGDVGSARYEGEVRAGTTSPMPDHKGFKLQ